MSNNDTKIFGLSFVKGAFVQIEIQFVFVKDLHHTANLCMMVMECFREDEDVIDVDYDLSIVDFDVENLILSSIMVWKVAGEFVKPKNMTVGLKRPRLVLKAAFHSSPSLIRTLLYPQRTSSFVKYLAS